ncbi:CaiB/BaiF CoA transferase family protein [Sphingomonas sp.]|uniref:CaiB/BaiF CoA transferase family protein n=1 Tax=Sphingomonas sp. TaxID=28214 RepID=UPI0037515D29
MSGELNFDRMQAAGGGFSPLAHIRVLDFSKILAGPLCTQYLADLGANVIKVEPPSGDDTRHWPPFEDGIGTIFLAVNRNKRDLVVDLRRPEGRALCRQLAIGSDVVVESFGPGVADRLGIGWEAMQAVNPRLVYASISGFGTQGPMKGDKGYDLIAQAFTGMLALTGAPDGPPARSPFSPIDQATGYHAVIGILAALMQRDQTGIGVKIETSLFDSAVGFLGYFLQSYWQRGVEPVRPGSGHESLCPYQAFDTADRPIILGIANDGFWRSFCDLVERPELALDQRFATGSQRVENRETVVALVADLLRGRTRAEWLAELGSRNIPASPVHSLGELSAHPHTEASGMVLHDGDFKAIATPIRASGQRLGLRRQPPLLGQHSREIVNELELPAEEIDRLFAQGVIAEPASTHSPNDHRGE